MDSPAEKASQPSYIDYETFLAPEFDPAVFANSLVLSTNNPNDTPLDLSTPLSRVLFDIQEIDSHIDELTARSAIPLLTHAKERTDKSTHTISELQPQMESLQTSYKRLEKEVIMKHTEANEVRRAASTLWETLRLGRSVGRCLQLGRQLEVQHSDYLQSSETSGSDREKGDKVDRGGRGDHRALVRCAVTILSLREMTQLSAPGEEGEGLDRVEAIRRLHTAVINPIQKSIQDSADRILREFSLGSSASALTFAQTEDVRARTVSALMTLYLISPTVLRKKKTEKGPDAEVWAPTDMLKTLESYLRAALQSSISGLARSLAALPSLERTLSEVSARCQNIVALEAVLASTPAPPHPLRDLLVMNSDTSSKDHNLLQPLLSHLETGSLASYFWRTLASNLAPRVQDIVVRGGVSMRTLRSNKNSVGEAIRECVLSGVQLPSSMDRLATAKSGKTGSRSSNASWSREVAVMMGSVLGPLDR